MIERVMTQARLLSAHQGSEEDETGSEADGTKQESSSKVESAAKIVDKLLECVQLALEDHLGNTQVGTMWQGIGKNRSQTHCSTNCWQSTEPQLGSSFIGMLTVPMLLYFVI